jgi:hypothetical protein
MTRKNLGSKLLRLKTLKLLTISFGILVTLNGCRLGNAEVPQTQPESYTGYYVTAPQKLSLSIVVSGATAEAPADLGLIPRLVTQFMTNPVFFGEVDKATGLSGIAPPKDTSRALPVYLSSDGSLAFSGTTKSQTFFIDPRCQSHLEITEKGALHKNKNVTSPKGNKLPLSGSLSLDVGIETVFEGECQPTFDNLATCYTDATQCGGADDTENETIQAAVVSAFSPFINAHLLTPSEIANVTGFSYDVSYE